MLFYNIDFTNNKGANIDKNAHIAKSSLQFTPDKLNKICFTKYNNFYDNQTPEF